ncbi:MAG: bifunctional oligoribonuclease/PAP phosphatase NrnA [Eubacteriales bacterium]|nr:bifunctional oligoribonuclease/PAP phosphatase NrnA [Eubacteriales bacterium]MDD3289609.1 bifunctional oligoribonuclease/PAP phosphatase NrnA [Eubacteriales bacterium]MDD3863821.1 bifunctional oligoribonuclease/PAP phosphatase NrnA [Eubacteriales bacterium]MDD4444264.1 bifunctional oligoribonuclease/PAP phosphatase NrnA [Eubacteriales bacterium]
MESMLAIAQKLKTADSVLLFPHINMDGDALGSSVALCLALRQLGKTCSILIEDDIPEYLAFLDKGYCIRDAVRIPDVSLAVDCGDVSRIENRREIFYAAADTACIDHHLLHADFARDCLVDSGAAATGTLVFRLLEEMNIHFTPEIADALYVAIMTDTGSFRYSNADRQTHLIIARLYEYGLDHVPLCNAIYDNIPLSQVKLEASALQNMEIFAGGRACIAHATLDMVEAAGATPDQTENIIDRLRSIRDVEIAVFLKEKADGNYKVSFRAKSYADVGTLAYRLGGGGHRKAAGCTVAAPLGNARDLLRDAVEQELDG